MDAIQSSAINHIAREAYRLMQRKNLVTGPGVVFYAWPRPGRLVLIVDPTMIKNQGRLLSAEFRHDLSTILGGRRVVQTNSRGIYIQVEYSQPPAPGALKSVALDLSKQPGPLHIPIGLTRSGPFWVALVEADSILIAGRRRMGKTRVMHGIIQALLHGGQAELYLRDGKGGMEFARYGTSGAVHLAQNNLRQVLIDLQTEVNRRQKILSEAGVTSMSDYNDLHPESRMAALVLVVDEVAHIPEDCRPILSDLIGRCGAYGVYPILGTTYPGHKEVGSLIKANIGMRIALPVPTQSESRVILGIKGAEELPNVKGRMLLEWNARLIEAQAFQVDLPSGGVSLGPRLTGRDLEIARFAVEGEGYLSIALLKQFDSAMTDKLAYKLLREWEGRGWVVKDPFRSNARKITHALREVYGKSGEAGESGKSGKSGEEGESNVE